jgi:hypothetical protein
MPKIDNAFEVFKLLEKSNCGDCGEKTCLAFAAAVFKGRRLPEDCPRLDRRTIERFSAGGGGAEGPGPELVADFEKLRSAAASMDLRAAARRVGGRYAGGRLTLKIFGKDFSIDARGRLSAEIHVNPWVATPFLACILHGQGVAPSGRWVSFRDLKDGIDLYPIFLKRCEEPLKRVADRHPDLFRDLVELFGGKKVEGRVDSDISVVLHPLPRVPIRIGYWREGEGMPSGLRLLFDDTAEKNLPVEALFTVGAGLAQMLTKIAERHGGAGPQPRG